MPTPYKPAKPQTQASPPIGSSKCQCPTCKEWFSGEHAFERHRAGEHATGRYCVDPASVGLVIKHRKLGSYWGFDVAFPADKFAEAA